MHIRPARPFPGRWRVAATRCAAGLAMLLLSPVSSGTMDGGTGPAATGWRVSSEAAAPQFHHGQVDLPPAPGPAPTGLLVNGLPGTSGATLTQRTPVFGWAVGGGVQTAYEILIATGPALLTTGAADVWTSGRTAAADSLNVPFAGRALADDTTYHWTVRTWDRAGNASAFAAPQTFRTGTLTAAYRTDAPRVAQEAVPPTRFVRKGAGWYFVDFGQDAFGTVRLTVPAPVAGQVITVGMGEALSDATTVNARPAALGGCVRYQSRSVTLRDGVTSYTATPVWSPLYAGWIAPPGHVGQVAPFRYVEIKNVPEPFAAEQIAQLAAHVPFDDAAAAFTSSDPLLDAIWAVSKHTTKAATFTGYLVDGDRERIPYEADGYIGMLNLFCLTGDYATPRRNHEHLLAHPTWPTEWLAHSIFMAHADYLYTGDTRSLSAHYPALQAKLLASRVRPDGLQASPAGGAPPTDIVDWPATERDGYDMAMPVKTVTSAFRYRALVCMQEIATALGKTDDASGYAAAAALTRGSINSKLWDAENNRYLDGMSAAGVPDAHTSVHANFFPLAFGVVPADRQAAVAGYLKARGTAAGLDMLCSPYGAQYLFEALYAAGEGEYALSLFDSTALRSWHHMLSYQDANGNRQPRTMTQEAWDVSLKPNEDWNHVWGAAAANLIPRWLMGVRPLAPGFGKILIQPQPGTLAHAGLTVPTVRGPVGVTVRANTGAQFVLGVQIPANTTARVGLPTLGSDDLTVLMDGAVTTGTISGATIFVDDVPPGLHEFERRP